MSKNNPNIYVKFPMNFPAGLGYSPAAAGPVGGWSNTPGPGFFGKQPMDSLLPRLTGLGSTPRGGRFFGSRNFGYPLMNRPSANLNEQMFPRYPVGNGSSPGGDGGVWLQGMPGFQSYWGFGNKRRRSRRKSRRSKRKSRRSKRKSRRSKRKSSVSDHRWKIAVIDAIKSRNKKKLRTALDNFDQSLEWKGSGHPLYKKGIKMLKKI
jgi:hypothetical protein